MTTGASQMEGAMKRVFLILALSLALSPAALAADPVCGISDDLLKSPTPREQFLEAVAQNCKPGQVLRLARQRVNDTVIYVCDFSKQILIYGNGELASCVMSDIRLLSLKVIGE
jgi:hypothetical protein